MSTPDHDAYAALMAQETQRRIDTYHDHAPGMPGCAVEPFTFKHVWHSIYLSVVLVGLFVYGAVSIFPAYFHG